jgi:hypothetical protein
VGLQVLQLLWDVFEWPLTPLRILIGIVAVGFPFFILFTWYRREPAASPVSTQTAVRKYGGNLGKAIGTAVRMKQPGVTRENQRQDPNQIASDPGRSEKSERKRTGVQ